MAKKTTTKRAPKKVAEPKVNVEATPKSQLFDVVNSLNQCSNVLNDCNTIEFQGRNTIIRKSILEIKSITAILTRIAK